MKSKFQNLLSYYGNVRIEGPSEDVMFILKLIQEAEAKAERVSAFPRYPYDNTK